MVTNRAKHLSAILGLAIPLSLLSAACGVVPPARGVSGGPISGESTVGPETSVSPAGVLRAPRQSVAPDGSEVTGRITAESSDRGGRVLVELLDSSDRILDSQSVRAEEWYRIDYSQRLVNCVRLKVRFTPELGSARERRLATCGRHVVNYQIPSGSVGG